eukprot:gene13592-15000_t
MVYINDSPSTTKDLGASRVAFDEAAVCRVYDIFSTWGNPFEFNESLFNIASGLVASPDVSRDLLNAGSCGEAALQRFFKERVNSGEKPFYDAIPRCNLKSFAALKVKKLCKLKEKSITINAERGIFANLLVIREKRETTSMRDLLSFSLGPIPWSLALPMEVLVSKGQSKSIFLVTDQYLPNSVEEMERNRRTAGGAIKFTLNRREQKRPKQFKKYLSDPCNKIQLVKFLIADWSNSDRFKSKIGNRCIYVTVEDKCYAIYVEEEEVRCTEAEELFSNQEEADTKTFFAANTLNYWDMETYALIGSKNLTRVLDIKAIYDNIGPSVASSLPALHAFTGCDYTSAFHGIGKVKALKVLKKDERFQYVFGVIGDDFEFDGDLFEIIQEFVCTLYGLKSLSDVNEARYKKFCSSKRKIPEPQQLPPTSDELLQQCKRVSYVAGIVKRAFEPNPEVPSLHGFGWKINSDALEIEWMTKSPAPDSILELVSCNCKKLNVLCKTVFASAMALSAQTCVGAQIATTTLRKKMMMYLIARTMQPKSIMMRTVKALKDLKIKIYRINNLCTLVYYIKCSNKECEYKYEYDGLEDGLLNVGQHLVSHKLLRRFMLSFLRGRMPIYIFHSIYVQEKRDDGLSELVENFVYNKFKDLWYSYLRLTDIDKRIDPLASFLQTVEKDSPENIPRYSKFKERIMIKSKSCRTLLLRYCNSSRCKKNRLSRDEYDELLDLLQMESPDITTLVKEINDSSVMEDHQYTKPNKKTPTLSAAFTCPHVWVPFIEALGTSTPVCGVIHQDADLLHSLEELIASNSVTSAQLKTFKSSMPILHDLIVSHADFQFPKSLIPVLKLMIERSKNPFKNAPLTSVSGLLLTKDRELRYSHWPKLYQVRERGVYEMDVKSASRSSHSCNKKSTGHPTLLPGIFTMFVNTNRQMFPSASFSHDLKKVSIGGLV